jgi:hypothetical protein
MARLAKIRNALTVGAFIGGTWLAHAQAEPRPRVEFGPERVLAVLAQIDRTLVSSSYSHVTRVDPKAGLYEFDCSGMAAWVLQRGAPGAYQAVLTRSATGRPVARDFYRTIAAVAPGRPSWAWQRVAKLEDVRPGDVVAWTRLVTSGSCSPGQRRRLASTARSCCVSPTPRAINTTTTHALLLAVTALAAAPSCSQRCRTARPRPSVGSVIARAGWRRRASRSAAHCVERRFQQP